MRLLRLDGHAVDAADTLADGARLCASGRYDLIIADAELPGGSGLSVLALARSTHRSTRAIAVTGHTDAAHRAASVAAGFDAHLCKPIVFGDLLAAVRRIAPPGATPTVPVAVGDMGAGVTHA